MRAFFDGFFHVLGEGVEESGDNTVDVDVVSGPLHGKDTGELDYARLGYAVHYLAPLSAIPKPGGDVDDLAVLAARPYTYPRHGRRKKEPVSSPSMPLCQTSSVISQTAFSGSSAPDMPALLMRISMRPKVGDGAVDEGVDL